MLLQNIKYIAAFPHFPQPSPLKNAIAWDDISRDPRWVECKQHILYFI